MANHKKTPAERVLAGTERRNTYRERLHVVPPETAPTAEQQHEALLKLCGAETMDHLGQLRRDFSDVPFSPAVAVSFYRAHEPEILQRWFASGHFGCRPRPWWSVRRPYGVIKLHGESQLQCLHRLGLLTAAELTMWMVTKGDDFHPLAHDTTGIDGER